MKNPSALAQSVVWTGRTANEAAPRVSLLQALAVRTKSGRHAAACRLRDFGGGGRFEVQLCPVSRGSCRTAEQRKGTEDCGTLLMAAAWLAWKWMENGKGNGSGRRCEESRVCRICKPNKVCTVSRRSGRWSAVVSTVSTVSGGTIAAVDGNKARPAAVVVVDDDWARAGMDVNVTGPQGWLTKLQSRLKVNKVLLCSAVSVL